MSLLGFSNFDPIDRLLNLQRDLENAFQKPMTSETGLSGHGLFPPVNAFRDREGGIVMRLEVPGITPDSLQVDSQAGSLRISGKREISAPDKASFHRRERPSGDFSRNIQLPNDLDTSRAQAKYKHGVLMIQIPKREEAKPRQISVKVD
jgi:HSP20 family protein